MAFGYSEITRRQKKRFYIFLAIFIIGFILLGLIGESINENGLIVLGFLAPVTILVGIIGITWSLYRNDEEKK